MYIMKILKLPKTPKNKTKSYIKKVYPKGIKFTGD